ncbi:MAG: alpha/beta hydrolase [Steroidobacteraceae bacterium]
MTSVAFAAGPAPAPAAAPAADGGEFALYPGAAPGSEKAPNIESRDFMIGEWKVRNVTRPTLTPYLPDPDKANGTAVIVAPGGGFSFLSVQSEGENVARWLAARGITAFMLKYRLNTSPVDAAAYDAELKKMFASIMNRAPGTPAPDLTQTPGAQMGMADGLAAIRRLRADASRWNIAPDRIGLVGFSAGGMVATHVASAYDAASRPDFVGAIYGGASNLKVPDDAPPLFLAVSADDPLLATASTPIFEAWRARGRPAELHIYEKGGHGFGLNKSGASSDHWIDEFYWWLEAGGFIKRGM